MTREEAINIKDEILKKEGSIHICNAITIDGVVLIKDILDIIDKHIKQKSEEIGMETDDRCKECKKDWTKCGTCPVMMKWVREHKKEHKHERL